MKGKVKKKKISLFDLLQRTRKIWLIVIASLFLTVLNSIIIVSTSYPIIKNLYINTIGEKAYLLRKIEKLVPETNILFFKQNFGDPTFININEKNKEYVFVNKYFYLDATTDLNDKVLYYAVTTRDKNFNPEFKTGVFSLNGDQIIVKLGITKFSEIKSYPDMVDGCVGAHDWFYYETHYLGNPSNYQTYAFGVNMAGYGSESVADDIYHMDECNWDDKNPGPYVKENVDYFRERNVVNTYLITGPHEKIVTDYLGIGVNYYQVRILK